VERAKQHPSDQLQAVEAQRIAKGCWAFRHIADGAKLDSTVAGGGTVPQHRLPRRIAAVACEFDTPGAGCITNADCHGRILSRPLK